MNDEHRQGLPTSDFYFGEYGRVINAAGRLIGETNGIYIRDVEYEIERGRAGPAALARFIDNPKQVLEQREEELSSIRPPKQLRRFHDAYVKGVRATILRWGCIRREALGSASNMQALAIDQFGRASLELASLSRTEPSLLQAVRLDSGLAVVLWKDIAWMDHAVRGKEHATPATSACDSCGQKVQEDARFCTQCGVRVGLAPPTGGIDA